MAVDRDPRVAHLREQLRALGYLDSRVDRFVLGGAVRRQRPSTLAAAATLRMGVLAGALLGPAAAIGLRWRAPGLVTSTTDAVVLALYLGVLFGLGSGLAAFGAILAGGFAARRGATRPDFGVRARRAATMAGLVIGAACLIYLVLWWRSAIGLTESWSLAATVAILAVAVAISLLLGHAVTLTVLASLARTGLGESLGRGLPFSSWRATAPMATLALAGAVTLLVATAPRANVASEAPTLTTVPTGLRLIMLAIDGVDRSTLDRLRAAGRLPHFERLLAGSQATMPAEGDRDPARVWTTIATGQPPERHGIRALESREITGLEGRVPSSSPGWSTLATATDLLRLTRPAIASGRERLIPAFWEVAARVGLRTAVVHWWATWPPPDDLGVVVSDRAILRLAQGGPLDGEITPASLYPRLAEIWPAVRASAHAKAARLDPPEGVDDVAAVLARSAELDASIAGLASHVDPASLDLLVIYLPGLDIVQHALFGAAGAVAPSVTAARVAAMEQYYAFLDDLIGSSVLQAPGQDRAVVLVTEPGRVAQPTAGLMAVSGVDAGAIRRDGHDLDVAPTVLSALGVPLARDLAGRAMPELFGSRVTRARHPLDVTTYGSRRAVNRPGAGKPLDQEMIERMRSLGYIK